MLTRRLRKRGFEVVAAEDGPAALAAVEAGGIELVVLDVMMPGMSGLEVLTRLRGQPETETLPVIMATARSESADVVEALGLGANDYVTQPIDFPVLVARIDSLLRRSRGSSAAPGRRASCHSGSSVAIFSSSRPRSIGLVS